ncbi:MAG: hypothetical protein IJ569_07290 [Prevotella sp.]|nr:hypothetical protein [Prevotella sp.]
MKKLLIALMAVCLYSSCSKKDEPEPETKYARTVLIYMAAENNLNSDADKNLTAIKQGVKSIGNNCLAVYVDKADSKANPYYLYFRNGEQADTIWTETDELTADAAVLEKVARKAFSDNPASSYGLVLWGHASGWTINEDSVAYTAMARRKAYGGDAGNNSPNSNGKYWMNIPSMAKALSQSGIPHLAFIFADCCNFQCLESAYELRNVADYLIGSPAEIPGVGAPYQTVVPAMFETSTFYSSIIDRYYEQREMGYDVPLSAIKLSEMGNLASATRTVLKTFAGSLDKYPDLTDVVYYYYDTSFNYFQQYYDPNSFILKYASADNYQIWKQAFDKAVVYKKIATEWMTNKNPWGRESDWNKYYGNFFKVTEENFGGVSMYIPRYSLDYPLNAYINKMAWYYAAGYSEIGW